MLQADEAFVQKWKKKMEDYWPDKQIVEAKHIRDKPE